MTGDDPYRALERYAALSLARALGASGVLGNGAACDGEAIARALGAVRKHTRLAEALARILEVNGFAIRRDWQARRRRPGNAG